MKHEPVPETAKTPKRKADQYNDPTLSYPNYWNGRDYEDAAERMAIERLLEGKHFQHALDVGGGYGRLSVLLERYADQVTLIEPSRRQLDTAKHFLKDHPEVDYKLLQAADLDVPDSSVDLLTMVRVMNHLPDPTPEFAEFARVLSPNGYAIIEVANYTHARNRLKYLLKAKKIPAGPIDISSNHHADKSEIPFVNHNPETVIKQLAHAGFKIERILSVSNLRSTTLKKIMPRRVMLAIEGILQPTLANSYFGPSVFFLVKRG